MKWEYRTVDITKPVEGRVINLNRYWLCKDDDPKQAIFYGTSAQCNKYESIVERLIEYTEDKSGWKVGIVFVEIAYRPNNYV